LPAVDDEDDTINISNPTKDKAVDDSTVSTLSTTILPPLKTNSSAEKVEAKIVQKEKEVAKTKSVAIDQLQLECPRRACPANSVCGHSNGTCCGDGKFCCPQNAVCMPTTPPSCMYDDDPATPLCPEKFCSDGFECPHAGISFCCADGKTCCPQGYRCYAKEPGKCVRINKNKDLVSYQRVIDQANQVCKLIFFLNKKNYQ